MAVSNGRLRASIARATTLLQQSNATRHERNHQALRRHDHRDDAVRLRDGALESDAAMPGVRQRNTGRPIFPAGVEWPPVARLLASCLHQQGATRRYDGDAQVG